MTEKDVSPAVRRVSSPTSTGGTGTLFEQQVDATFLSLLLVRGIPPILTDCVVTEVHMQTERKGWATDDIMVVGVDGAGTRRRLFGQVKLGFTISSSDDECRGTIGDFWDDFCENSDFSRVNDRFVVIVMRGTNTLLGHFATLLDCARASTDAADFEHRLQTPGFVGATVARYFSVIRSIVNDHAGSTVAVDELWQFLRVIHVLSLDLATSTRQTETQHRTLLAHTANGADPIGAADATWAELVQAAGEGMTHSRSYCRTDLPQTVLERHSPVPEASHIGLTRLAQHFEVILEGIRSTVGGRVHLRREQLVQSLLEKLEESQVVVVTGPAGGGKSGVAKEVVLLLADHFAFGFRAEEFAAAHLNETLHRAQIPANASTLAAMMAGQDRKILLVESVERLLEKSTRDAFSDLLALLKNDGSWRLILTCRDYSSELVRSSLLQFAGVDHSVLVVPPLSDEELATVRADLPALSRPLANSHLSELLRNLYLLDKASQMDWPEDRPLPEDERAFRTKFWAEVIRADDRPGADMPRRRHETMVEIALRRARALTQYVNRGELDSEAIHALRSDSLIVHPEGSDALVAPAHDVLEDWSILKWIEEQYQAGSQTFAELASVLGTYPAIRRTYRKWLSELVARDSTVADSLLQSAATESSLSPQFRDDTMVALLQSASSGDLLRRHSALLFADDRQILRRIIHLLRVACVSTPVWFGGGSDAPSVLHVPDGAAWTTVLQLVAENLISFGPNELPLILGLAEDAARGISWRTPYPVGSDHISTIACALLPYFDDYRSEEQRERVLKMIAKLPNCNQQEFAALLGGDPDAEQGRRRSREFRELVLWGMEGLPACRDMPDNVVAAVRNDLLVTEEMIQGRRSYGDIHEVDDAFGIRSGMRRDCFPASAYCGPFLQLLRYHPVKAIGFLVELFDYSGNWYGSGRMRLQFVELPYQITLTFSDGTQKTQWCNSRLWNLYRGTSVGPYVLQSALMALEQWLLSIAERQPDELDGLLSSILKRSSNAAITAVVASAATANPRLSPETLLALLSSPDCILLDRGRMVAESQTGVLTGMMPFPTAEQRIFNDERRQANAMGHRRHDLEAAIANAQLGTHTERIQELIDNHRAAIPPAEQRTEEDRIWWLALHRMDLRQYTVASAYKEDEREQDASEQDQPTMIRLDLLEAEPDVQQMMDASQADYEATEAQLTVLMWGIKVFSREEDARYDPSLWRTRLEEAKSRKASVTEEGPHALGRGGPEHVASVCIRDHFDDMTHEEQTWCVETVCQAIESEADNWNDMARRQRNPMAGDRPSAYAISCLMVKSLPDGLDVRVRSAFACAVLHPTDEVRQYAVAGVGRHLWADAPALATRCVNVLASEAQRVQALWRIEDERPYLERSSYGAVEATVGGQMYRDFYGDVDADAYEQLDIRDWTGSEANSRILSILAQAPTQELAIRGFQRLAATMVESWDEEARRGHRNRQECSIDVQIALTQLLQESVLKVDRQQGQQVLEPILDAVDRHPKEASEIIRGIVGDEDRLQRTDQFWHLWGLFAERVKTAPWLAHLDGEYPAGGPVLSAIFMTQYWKDDVRHWRSLEGYDTHVTSLFETLPPTAIVLDNFVRFLYHIGEHSLPAAFRSIAERLREGNAQAMLRMSNTVFMLESLLRRFVYGRPLQLKTESVLRDAVLYLLDVLVECGSSSAYRMRDDFVTPAH